MAHAAEPNRPDDYVLATGVGHTVTDFLETAFGHVALDWRDHVQFDQRYLRPTEVDALVGDASKAADELGWSATAGAEELAGLMVDADIAALAHEGSRWVDEVPLDDWTAIPTREPARS